MSYTTVVCFEITACEKIALPLDSRNFGNVKEHEIRHRPAGYEFVGAEWQ